MGIFDSFKGKRLIKALKDEDVAVRTNAADALGEMGELAVEPLVDALNDISGDVRGAAARSLGKIGDSMAVSRLVQDLDDVNRDVRKNVVWSLGRSGILTLSDTFCRL